MIAAIVPAAGRGERLGPGAPKALRLLGGEPLLVHAVRTLSTAPSVGLVAVAAPPGGVDVALRSLHPIIAAAGAELIVVEGGATRQASVAAALASLPSEVEIVLVHDAARPLVPPALVESVARAVAAGADAVVPGLPVADTVKQVDEAERVVATLDRSALRAIQTPQGFRRAVLERAHAAARGESATDDAGLVERLGVAVLVVPGAEEAFKVTRPFDLVLAEAVLAARKGMVHG